MVISDLTNPFFVELAVGIEHALYKAARSSPFLANSAEDPIRQRRLSSPCASTARPGMILCARDRHSAERCEATSRGTAGRLTVMRRLPGLKASLVAPGKSRGREEGDEPIWLRHGHKRIAFIGGTTSLFVREERLGGCRHALEEAGVPLDEALVIETMNTYAGGGAAVAQLLALPEPATAALCFNDVVAIGLDSGADWGRRRRRARLRRHRLRRHRRSQAHGSGSNEHRREPPQPGRPGRATAHASDRNRKLRAGSGDVPDEPDHSRFLWNFELC